MGNDDEDMYYEDDVVEYVEEDLDYSDIVYEEDIYAGDEGSDLYFDDEEIYTLEGDYVEGEYLEDDYVEDDYSWGRGGRWGGDREERGWGGDREERGWGGDREERGFGGGSGRSDEREAF